MSTPSRLTAVEALVRQHRRSGRTIIAVILAGFVGCVAFLGLVFREQEKHAEMLALAEARHVAQTLGTFQNRYAEAVADILMTAGHGSVVGDGGLPLPLTLTKRVAQDLRASGELDIRVVSPTPVPTQGGRTQGRDPRPTASVFDQIPPVSLPNRQRPRQTPRV